MADHPSIVLIDGHALAYRAFHALPADLSTPTGEPTNAVLGFASMLLEVMSQFHPEYMVVTFDRGRTFRHEVYADYKATREAMPEALERQLGRIRELVDAFGIPIFEVEGWEADDLLGTLAAQAERQGVDPLIVTGDTDAFQLVDAHTRVVTSGRRFSDTVIYDLDRVRERYGIEPEALPDWKGLRGDSSDNIPGVPGIGDKTASKLLAEYGSVANVLDHADEVKGEKLRAALVEHAEQARLGVELATIRRDVPVHLDLPGATFAGFDRARVLDLFRTLAFRTLVDRLPDMPDTGEGEATLEGDYRTVTSLAEVEKVVARLAGAPAVVFDTETTSKDQMRAELVGVALTDDAARAWYVPVGHLPPPDPSAVTHQPRLVLAPDEEAPAERPEQPGSLPLTAVAERLAPVLEGKAPLVAHNAKYDLVVLRRHGIEVTGPLFDTMVAAWVAEPARRNFGLKELAWSKLGMSMTSIGELIGRGRDEASMAEVLVTDAAPYACADADATCRLYELLLSELDTTQMNLLSTVEIPMVRVLADMEMAGVLVDPERLATIRRELAARLTELEDEIYAISGNPFNIASPQQLGQVLFEQLKIPKGRRTQTGYSTSADALAGLEDDYPIVALVLEWRHLSKLKGTYVDTLPALIHPETGRIHTSFQQTAVVTGRISSSDPNLQNIPVRTEQGGQIRSAFVAPPGDLLLSADYSQMELRVLAHLADDPTLKEIFASGGDIHAATGAFLFDKAPEDVTSNERRIAKVVNFGVLYGMSAYGLADRTGLSRAEAGHFIDRYFETYSSVRGYYDRLFEAVAERGYVETILGRRRYFPELRKGASSDRNTWLRARREAMNAPIQGSAADVIKVAMIHLHAALAEKGLRSRMLLQVHDELLLEVPEDEMTTVPALVRDLMVHAVPMHVELAVDLSAGPSWLELQRLP